MKKNQQGFTLIELVIVIVILGLLAATALPRFSNLTGEARTAALAGVTGGFRSAIAITHAQWLATGESSPITMQDGTQVAMNISGWPDLSGSQDAGAAYNNIMSQSFAELGTDWSHDSSTTTTAVYTLSGTGGGTFTYSENNGSVTCSGC